MPTEHTPEPWKVKRDVGHFQESILAADTRTIAVIPDRQFPLLQQQANTARIVACVNACKGLSLGTVEAIASGGGGLHSTEEEFQDILHATRNREQRDRLLAVLGPLLALTEQFAHAVNPKCFAQLEAEGKLPSSILGARAAIAGATS